MKRVHRMPFGAEISPAGVRFRLWAPSAREVAVCLDDGSALPMTPVGKGYYELSTPLAQAGSRYRFRIDGGIEVPDPASRYNPDDVHAPSEVIDPADFDWQDARWRGRPWHEAVVYELHVGSFSETGSYTGVEEKLGELAALGVTAIELMPLADFPGARNWGYDGVLPFAPDSSYGRPEDLKRLIQSAHRHGLMVLLDVVYNHFGPEGNYLHAYAEDFFTDRHQTPWGAAINFDDPGSNNGPGSTNGHGSAQVRQFFIHNALYWLSEYHLDGLRLDAVHAIKDESKRHILQELSEAVRAGPGREREREIHLVLENEANNARYLRWGYDAQWNDDIHHCFHTLLTGEADGYYSDYAEHTLPRLGRCLAEGYGYQGEDSPYHRAPRGEPSADLPPTRFVNFVQNHDQIGNRALGERLTELTHPDALKAALAVLLLAPSPPLLFMGEEWGSRRPFPFFCDFGPDLARAVSEGRRREFARFEQITDPAALQALPDPCDPRTFASAKLDWAAREQPEHAGRLAFYRQLLELRHREITPRLVGVAGNAGSFETIGEQGLCVAWRLGDGSRLSLVANLSDEPLLPAEEGEPLLRGKAEESRRGRRSYGGGDSASPRTLFASDGAESEPMPPWSLIWRLEEPHA